MSKVVKKPRFYVNYNQFFSYYNYFPALTQKYLHTINYDITSVPSSQNINIWNTAPNTAVDFYNLNEIMPNCFVFILGIKNLTNIVTTNDSVWTPLVTSGEGWILLTVDKPEIELKLYNDVNSDISFNSIVAGSYWEAPHSPDLRVTQNYSYAGIRKRQTKGGHYISNTNWSRPPKWNGRGAWEQGSSQYLNLYKSGRRSWDISFSYLSDDQSFPDSTNLLKDSYNNVNSDDGTLVNKTETDIFSRLIHPTAGGSLPFIFQPDSTNFAADQFAICTLDQNSIGFQQTSPSLYNIRLKVVEIW